MLYENQKTKNISFPLGGIGTGCIGLTGNGELCDWEIFNRPNKNSRNGYSHFAIKAEYGEKSTVRVLHGDTNENYIGTHIDRRHVGFGFGPRGNSLAGVPHFKKVRFEGTFPIANLTFTDSSFPAVVRLCAFNPLIPHDDFHSGIPAAFFEWEIENTEREEICFSIAFSAQNPATSSLNQKIQKGNMRGVFFSTADKKETEIDYCDLTILTNHTDAHTQEYWYRGGWQDSITAFWEQFSARDRLPERRYETAGENDHGTLVARVAVPAKEKRKIRFVLAWNTPIQYNYWDVCKDENGKDVTWKNYYATQFENSFASATYALEKFSWLYEKTEKFSNVLQGSSMPKYALDAISANLSVLKSPTVLRYEDGTFWGWEGVHETYGSCEGTCQHVWNYAYALPFLFPKLERSIRESMLNYAFYENGKTDFRVLLPFGKKKQGWPWRACVDGQMGEIIKCYREWKISGDTDWLKSCAPKIFKMLEWAWSEGNGDYWDLDRDGVLEGRQHHTLDMELFGPSSWLEGFYLLALDCGAKIAEALGDTERVNTYRTLYEKGKAWTNEHLFNGEYFLQKVDLQDKSTIMQYYNAEEYWNEETGEIKYQIGEGCMIDQMLADWHGTILGLDGVFDESKKRTALKSLYRYNYKSSMREVTNMWRNFSLNDESGTVICAYPDGAKKPTLPVPYCEETMTGFEYALAGLMISQGLIAEGETLVKAVRDRYDGEKRNPWNEIECGSNYARSMASYALLPIYSGFSFDMTEKYIGFSPLQKGDGRYLWSVGDSWGEVCFEGKKSTLSVLGNPIRLSSFGLKSGEQVSIVRADGNKISVAQNGEKITFPETEIQSKLEIEVK
ncbi:MAG: hypothetical protein IJW58_02235 [Clostridia bacterium]|nr:hypothetical protein [Clostridia bacterium]